MTTQTETALAKSPTTAEATAALQSELVDENVFVVASTMEEMNVAQKQLIGWATRKVELLKKEQTEVEARLDAARKQKYKVKPFERQLTAAAKKIVFYEKVKSLLELGYTIIPDMPTDLFAIRTTLKNPRRNEAKGMAHYANRPKDQETNSPPAGEGQFVQPQAFTDEHAWTGETTRGNVKEPVEMVKRWASEFDTEIEFPFKFAKPSVMNATAKALSEKLFDELGAAPARHVATKGDPMVIGRVKYKKGLQTKTIAFLVTWFIDSKDL